jgi:biopolymer transport protein ExbB/TolQ
VVQNIAAQFNAGGTFMWVILIVFAIALAVVIERVIYYFFFCYANAPRLVQSISRFINDNKSTEALTLLKKRSSPLYKLLRIAVERYYAGAPIAQIEEGIEEASIKEIPKITGKISYLSLFANIATLVGLLGTIAGLQQSFSSLASAEAAQKAAMLAAGIAQAMNTTAFGLIVAVPCMILFTLLSNKQQSLINDIDDAVVRVVNSMKTERA